MTSQSITSPESFFRDLPIQLKAGSTGKIFYVHPGVFVPFSSSAIYARVYGPWKDQSDEALDLTEFEEHTIECFLNYAYARDYCPFPTSPKSSTELQKIAEEAKHDTSEEKETCIDETITSDLGTDGLTTRPLTPIEDFVISELPLASQAVISTKGLNDNPDELLTIEVLTHARVYCFAHVYLLSDLEKFALNRLVKVLTILQHRQISMLPRLAEAIRLIYSKTPSAGADPARNLLSQFAALKFTSLLGEQFDKLMSEGGDFAVDVSYKLARKLLISPLEDKIEQLTLKVTALESECSGLEKDLNQSREEVRAWETWNQNLPSKRRRQLGEYFD
ncbi:uncharacterized protein TRUGW13939_07919 [Talaromyces rugulosus]|uniref:BTB domain-containing protein n=1 Tax=Talaromyces rugulosus TaxID=121627 RepID=A0A7H8R7M6_TALRU|nr:uncharacterized protein TRUGW13939_07919 [Talaromyces rugulosus]QKX60773.1 hypothetical protein TRUGW13939_07919 [Talaromyces rugulosus]